MAVTPLTDAEITSMLSKLTESMIGNGKSIHLAKAGTTLCGKSVDLRTVKGEDYPDYSHCKRCMVTAEKNYRRDRKISYGSMRDTELDRQTWGGKPFTQAEEKAAMDDGFVECTPEILAEALTDLVEPEETCVSFIGAGPTINGEVTMFATPTRIAEWLESGFLHQHTPKQTPTRATVCVCATHEPSTMDSTIMSNADVLAYDEWCKGGERPLTAYERVVNPDSIDSPLSGQYDDYDYASDEIKFAAMENSTAEMCAHGRVVAIQDGQTYVCGDCVGTEASETTAMIMGYDMPELEDNTETSFLVTALLSVEVSGVGTVSLGWQTIEMPFNSEKSLATLYAEQSGSTWHKAGAPNWDSIITVDDSRA